jgi:L-amino acid N-acyltransferase YncA
MYRLELMIAPTTHRRRGLGRATILTFLQYIQKHLPQILEEYAKGQNLPKARLVQLKVKIGSKNEKSIKLFESIGFIKVAEEPNYFGELELVFEGFLGRERVDKMLERWEVESYREFRYVMGDER